MKHFIGMALYLYNFRYIHFNKLLSQTDDRIITVKEKLGKKQVFSKVREKSGNFASGQENSLANFIFVLLQGCQKSFLVGKDMSLTKYF